MKSIIDQNLFRHKNSSSAQLNKLATIVHKLRDKGIYQGDVFLDKTHMGSFRINFQDNLEVSQVDIDASGFDPVYRKMKNLSRLDSDMIYHVGMEGFLVFHVSGHHTNVYMTLKKLGEGRQEDYFDSRRLSGGDMIIFRIIYPGEYRISNEIGKQVIDLTVSEAEKDKYYHPSKLEPLTIHLTEKGFEKKSYSVAPLQAFIITAGTPTALKLESKEQPKLNKKKKTSAG